MFDTGVIGADTLLRNRRAFRSLAHQPRVLSAMADFGAVANVRHRTEVVKSPRHDSAHSPRSQEESAHANR